jgi:hypothetical protein
MESKKSKGKRLIVFAILGIVVTLFAGAVAGGLAQGAASTQTHAIIQGSNSAVDYAWGQNASSKAYDALPIATSAASNGTYKTTVTNTYYAKITNSTGFVTGYKYDTVNILSTNLTLGIMNTYAVDKVAFATTGLSGNVTAVLGDGTSYDNFEPVSAYTVDKANHTLQNLTFSITPAMITGNQSSYMMLELEFSSYNITTYTVNPAVTGIHSTLFGYTVAEDIGYVAATGLLVVSVFFVIPFHDVSFSNAYGRMNQVVSSARKRSGGKGSKKNGKR